MRTLLRFFAGILILVFTGAILVVTSAVYDSAMGLRVNTYFFQPNRLSSGRPGGPLTPAQLGDDAMMQRLTAKYISEYFYVLPDDDDVDARMRSGSILARMSSPGVFADWVASEGQTVREIAHNRGFRIAHVGKMYKPSADSQYWTVEYELLTWPAPNDMAVEPIVSRGELYLDIKYEPGFIPDLDVARYLGRGNNPVGIFKFRVDAIGVPQDMRK